jgi:hypothetical protein
VFFGLDAGDDGVDLTLRTNHKRGSLDPQVFSAIHALFLENPKLFSDSLVYVGQERKRKLVGVSEFLLRGGLVRGDAQHLGASAVNLLVCVAEPARLIGSTRGIGFGIEKQDQGLSTIIFE